MPKLPWEGTDRDYTYQELLGAGLPCPYARAHCVPELVSWLLSHASGR